MTKVNTEPVPTTFSKDQVAGYESFSSQEYYRLAYEIAGDIIGGEYGIHKLEDYDLVWSPSGRLVANIYSANKLSPVMNYTVHY